MLNFVPDCFAHLQIAVETIVCLIENVHHSNYLARNEVENPYERDNSDDVQYLVPENTSHVMILDHDAFNQSNFIVYSRETVNIDVIVNVISLEEETESQVSDNINFEIVEFHN